MDEVSSVIRQLSIKVKVCQRLSKESNYYKVEAVENETKLEQMKSSGRDPYDIKKFEEVLGESHMMIPDSEARFRKALLDLQAFFEKNKNSIHLEPSSEEWVSIALHILEQNGMAALVGACAASVNDEQLITNVDDLLEGEIF